MCAIHRDLPKPGGFTGSDPLKEAVRDIQYRLETLAAWNL